MKGSKTFLIVFLLLALLLPEALLAGGGGEQPAPAAAQPAPAAEKPSAGPKRGGTLNAAMMVKITSMDPLNGNSFVGEGCVYLGVYNRLLRKDEAGKFVPELAKSWKVSEDGKKVTFELQQGVSFHDGTPFNAEAVKFNYDRLLDSKDAKTAYAYFADVESFQVVDPYTIAMNLKRPSAVVMDALTYRGGFIVSPTAFRKLGADYVRAPVGTGPFKWAEEIPGSQVVLTRNENYWEKGADGKSLPYLDKIVLRIITDDSVRLIEIQSGNTMLSVRVPAESMDIVQKDPKLEMVQTPIADVFRLFLNQRKAPFNNLKLRQAVGYAFDREAMAKAIVPGQGYVAPFLVMPGEAYFSKYDPYSYNPTKAKQLVAEAGYPNGLDVGFMMIAREPDNSIAPVVQSYLAAIGIRTTIEPLERQIYVQRGQRGEFDLALAQKTIPMVSPFLLFAEQLASNGSGNRADWKNARFDELLAQLGGTFAVDKQAAIVAEMQRLCLDDAGQTILFHRANYNANNRKVKGVQFQNEGAWRFTEAWLEP